MSGRGRLVLRCMRGRRPRCGEGGGLRTMKSLGTGFAVPGALTQTVPAQWQQLDYENILRTVVSLSFFGGGMPAATPRGVVIDGKYDGRWAASYAGLTETDGTCLVVQGNMLFAGKAGGGVFASSDSGKSWTAKSYGLKNAVVRCIVVADGMLIAGTNAGVFMSVNYGDTWTEQNDGFESIEPVESLAWENGRILSGTWDGVYSALADTRRWQRANTGLMKSTAYVFAKTSAALLAGTNFGVFIRADSASFWKSSGLTRAKTVEALAATDSMCFAGTLGGGVYASINLGASWWNAGLEDTKISMLTFSDGFLYAGTIGSGLFRAAIDRFVPAIETLK